MTEKLIWYPVPDHPGVFVNRLGEVGRTVEDKVVLVLGYLNTDGYKFCSINNTIYRQHFLVARTFHGPKPGPKFEVNHMNKDRGDNKPGNLEWVTKRRNLEHRDETIGTPWKTHKVPPRRLSEEDCKKLITDSTTHSFDELKKKYKVPKYFVKQLVMAHRQGNRDMKGLNVSWFFG